MTLIGVVNNISLSSFYILILSLLLGASLFPFLMHTEKREDHSKCPLRGNKQKFLLRDGKSCWERAAISLRYQHTLHIYSWWQNLVQYKIMKFVSEIPEWCYSILFKFKGSSMVGMKSKLELISLISPQKWAHLLGRKDEDTFVRYQWICRSENWQQTWKVLHERTMLL